MNSHNKLVLSLFHLINTKKNCSTSQNYSRVFNFNSLPQIPTICGFDLAMDAESIWSDKFLAWRPSSYPNGHPPTHRSLCEWARVWGHVCVLNVAKCLWQFVGPLQHRWPLYSPQKYIINLLANQIGDNNQAQPQHQAHSAVCLQDTQATRVVDPLPLQLICVGVERVCVSVYLCVVYVFPYFEVDNLLPEAIFTVPSRNEKFTINLVLAKQRLPSMLGQ